MITHKMVDGRLFWYVTEPAIGSVLIVEVDDEAAQATFVERYDGR
jgi:hypothetical protein